MMSGTWLGRTGRTTRSAHLKSVYHIRMFATFLTALLYCIVDGHCYRIEGVSCIPARADGCERYLLRPNGLFHDVAPLSASRQLQATEHRSLRREQGAIFGSLQTTGAALRSDLGVSQLRATTDNVLALFVEYVTFMKPLADRSVS